MYMNTHKYTENMNIVGDTECACVVLQFCVLVVRSIGQASGQAVGRRALATCRGDFVGSIRTQPRIGEV